MLDHVESKTMLVDDLAQMVANSRREKVRILRERQITNEVAYNSPASS